MKLLQLYYFKALAESEQLTSTAHKLYISSPSLSATISRLEGELGVKLFDRVGRNIRLNDQGRQFYAHVKLALDELDAAFAELKTSGAWNQHLRLNVATSTHILWEDVFAEYICMHPHVSFHHCALKLDKMLNTAEMAAYDLIITHLYDLPAAEYDSVILRDDRPGLVVWKGHPFADRQEISLKEACNENFIVLSHGFSMRKYFDQLFKNAGIQPNIVAEGDYALRANLVRSHYGIALSTTLGAQSIYLSGLKFIPLITNPSEYRVQALLWRKNKPLSPQAQAFKNFMISYFQHDGQNDDSKKEASHN